MLIARFRDIQPAERRRFTLDYSKRLSEGHLLTGFQGVDVTPATEPTFNVSPGLDASGMTVVLYTNGGVTGTEYKVELRLRTSDAGVLWEDEVLFAVEDV